MIADNVRHAPSRVSRREMLLRVLQPSARLATRLGILFYVVVSIIYLELGQFNSDEGWYLYGSRLIFQGLLPYKDFAYTQMPLLPYVYGVFQSLVPSILLGRLTCILLSFGTLLMSVVVARRYGGIWAGAATALLLATFTLGAYFTTVVKTYALVAFLLVATLFVLTSANEDDWKYPIALLFAMAAALVRVTALFFTAPVFLFALYAARSRTRLVLILEGVAGTLLCAFFLLLDWPSARWAIFSSHLRHWGPLSAADRIGIVLTERLVDIVQNLGPMLLLSGPAILFILVWRHAPWRRDPSALFAVTLGLALFAASHLVNGIWGIEYVVPAVVTALPIVAIAWSRIEHCSHGHWRLGGQVTFVALLVLSPLQEGTRHIDLSGGRHPLAEIGQVATLVAENTKPDDTVLALETLGVVVDAGRQVMPGLTLAQFSLQNMDDELAKQMHVVNVGMLVNAVDRKAVQAVILTASDWGVITALNPAGAGELRNALDANCGHILSISDFGQYAHGADVFVCR